ncbi:hypothetical protein EDB89DRAFT_1912476 [Lactarius sanguifluus]|nr:hypothetical protein EDB89DRAFT_1912476 [Lactarius sanguifluus]
MIRAASNSVLRLDWVMRRDGMAMDKEHEARGCAAWLRGAGKPLARRVWAAAVHGRQELERRSELRDAGPRLKRPKIDDFGASARGILTAQPGRDQRNYWRDAQDNAKWTREVSYIGRHVTPARDLPRMVQKSLDELAPRLRLEYGDPMTVQLPKPEKKPEPNWTATANNRTSGCGWGPAQKGAVAVTAIASPSPTGCDQLRPVATQLWVQFKVVVVVIAVVVVTVAVAVAVVAIAVAVVAVAVAVVAVAVAVVAVAVAVVAVAVVVVIGLLAVAVAIDTAIARALWLSTSACRGCRCCRRCRGWATALAGPWWQSVAARAAIKPAVPGPYMRTHALGNCDLTVTAKCQSFTATQRRTAMTTASISAPSPSSYQPVPPLPHILTTMVGKVQGTPHRLQLDNGSSGVKTKATLNDNDDYDGDNDDYNDYNYDDYDNNTRHTIHNATHDGMRTRRQWGAVTLRT